MELKGGRTMGTLRYQKQAEVPQKKDVEEYKKKRQNLPCTYSTSRLPRFPIRRAQHVQNVAMDSNNQPGNVLFYPMRQESNRHN
jgi:hypothetical protein